MAKDRPPKQKHEPGNAGETHQRARSAKDTLTTNQGIPVSDNQNSLRAGPRGPTLLEDFVLREKITHFDHERIPERVVHARGSGAHGYFQPYDSFAPLTRAAFLQDPGERTPVFVRFSTVAGGAGSTDLARDVRGFAVKFYTTEGNFDLVGNNMPVFFIQDAIKFPDLVHAVKMEPDRGYPQSASAHDTFWDFVSLTPESTHMLLWVMSDRAIPRSYRMMEGFGVHTFRLVNTEGESTFVKFHWRPKLGSQSVVWDEAIKISGADPDFHRRDLFEAIASGDYPEFELSVQKFDQETADALPFDVLDPTKIIPEEQIPLTPLGKMVLDRNPDNFFAEVEQAAFHTGNLVPGIDASNDPLMQGRLFSYLDTQLIRLGGPNFHQLPINAPKNLRQNYTRDGYHQGDVPKGRVNYEPNSLAPEGPRENARSWFESYPAPEQGEKLRLRSESFADHYSQARLFYRSMSEPERRHIVNAFAFELGKVETRAVRRRMLGRLALVESALCQEVEAKLGMEGEHESLDAARPVVALEPSPALSILKKAKPTLAGRKIGILVSDGSSSELIAQLERAIEGASARPVLIGPTVAGIQDDGGKPIDVHFALTAAPSVLFDAVVVAVAEDGASQLASQAVAGDWLWDAFSHFKVIGHSAAGETLIDLCGLTSDDGFFSVSESHGIAAFIDAAKRGRVWQRELAVRPNG